MKIFLTSTGDSLDSLVDPKFGRCDYFIIYDTDSQSFESKVNPYKHGESSVGISVAKEVIDSGATSAISVNFGPNAFRVLKEADIKTYKAKDDMTIKDAITAFLEGKLKEAGKPVSHEEAEKIYPHHHHHDGECEEE